MRNSVGLVALTLACADDPPAAPSAPDDEGPTPFANDNDADGYEPPFDCDDGDAQVYPGHGEFCNGVDDDCDGTIDDDAVDGNEGFVDADGDKAGDSSQPLVSCTVPGWAPVGGDCDDADPARSPAFTEACNAVDDDCALGVDNGAFNGAIHYGTIQDAILDAEEGATLTLCPDATQLEGGILVDRDVTITSEKPGAGGVVIDGSAFDSAVFLVDGGDLTLDGITVRGGKGTLTLIQTEFAYAARAGGAIDALTDLSGHVTVRNSTFEDNTASMGGAIAAVTLEVADSTFTRNGAEYPYDEYPMGGAVWIGLWGSFTIERTTFEGNNAQLGGAIQAWSSGLLADVEAFDNTGTEGGGFLRASSLEDPTTIELVGADIHDNVAYQGGGIDLVRASVTADAGTRIHHNDADYGAGVHIVSSGTPDVSASLTGGTIESNTAEGGGGLNLDTTGGGAIDVFDVAVTDNTATSGAGMRLVMGTLEIGIAITIWDSEIYANGATQGGGIYATGDEGDEVSLYPLVLENVEIAGNAAIEDGGGVWAEEVRVTTVGGAVRDNTAAQGGGVFLTTTGSLNCAETDFLGNEPEDVTIEGGVTYDAADTDATFSCNWTDPSCG